MGFIIELVIGLRVGLKYAAVAEVLEEDVVQRAGFFSLGS